ncbi:MAG: VWA domain-containing protein [Planctomycetota bacterium]
MDEFVFDRFAWPWAFWLFAVPVFVIIVVTIRRLRSRPSGMVYSGGPRLEGLSPTLRQRLTGLPFLIRLAVLASLIVALARPQHELGRTNTSTEGIAMQLVIDRSGSMEEGMEFEGRNLRRLDVVKQVASEFLIGNEGDLKGRQGDLIGMIAFATFADTVAPLTQSPNLVAEALQNIELARLSSESGTAIGDALTLALARLKRAEEELGIAQRAAQADLGEEPVGDTFSIKGKAVILLTDGENNQGEADPLQAAALAQQWGIRVYTIGIGGGQFVNFGGRRLRVGDGLDSRTLGAIAERTGGKFWVVTDAEALRGVYAEIDRLETTRIETQELTDYQEAFTPFAAFALALLAFEVFVRTAVLRRAP